MAYAAAMATLADLGFTDLRFRVDTDDYTVVLDAAGPDGTPVTVYWYGFGGHWAVDDAGSDSGDGWRLRDWLADTHPALDVNVVDGALRAEFDAAAVRFAAAEGQAQ